MKIVRVAALVYATVSAGVVAFQVALAAGAPWGAYAMGGAFPGQFPPALRIAALVQAALVVGMAAVVLSRAGLVLAGWSRASRRLVWAVVAFAAVSLVLNLITPSAGERAIGAPLALVLLASSAAVAVGRSRDARERNGTRTTNTKSRRIVMRRLSGPLLMATGVLDLLYVLAFHFRQLAAIAGDGFFGAVELDPSQLDREIAFWHLTFGTMVVILGGLVHWTQSRTGTLPAFLGCSLLALGLFGAILVPVSGFWLVLPPAAMMLVVARRGTTAEAGRPTRTERWAGSR